MAPGRKRGGAKGAKASNLNYGDLVLAKVKGFPAWPAKISNPADWQRNPDPRKCFVHFFGTEEIAFVAPVDIQLFTRESKDKLLNRCKGKTVKYFSQAVREICDVFDGLENKSSDSLKDGNDGQTCQSNANFMEMVDDGMTTDGPSGQTSPNDMLNQGPGLERCSHIHREMDNEDAVPNISPLVNNRLSLSTKEQAELSNDDITSPNGEGMSTSGAGHITNSKTGVKVETNGQKSKKTAKVSKNNHDGVDGINKVNSPTGVSCATENTNDGKRRTASHVSTDVATVGVANQDSRDSIKRTKNKTHGGLTSDLSKDVEGTGRKTKSELGLGNNNVSNNGVLHPTKKSKFSDDTLKKSQMDRKNEVRKSTLHLKTKNRLTSKGQTNGSGVIGDEDVVPINKRRRLVLEDMSSPTSMSENRSESSVTPKKGENTDSVKSGIQVPVKRRAVRICDEDEPKTPVHGRPSKVVDKASHPSTTVEEVAVVTEAIQGSPSLRKTVHVKEPVPNSQKDITETVEGKLIHTPGKTEPENKSSEEILMKFVSPIKSRSDANNKTAEPSKVSKSLGKASVNVSQKKGQSGSSKASIGINDSGHHSKNTAVSERSSAVFSGEKQNVTLKTTPKSTSRVNDSAAVLKKPSDSNLSGFSSERSELRVDRTASLADSGNADSSQSMRHLIAVAQAKRKQAQSHNLVHESNFLHTEAYGRSPGFVSTVQPTSKAEDQPDSAELERRVSSGQRLAGGSLSGGTEAAVARDAFEGMIETLSRTKESIGRATRHAIDCAKHGIASEVVELLTKKLENESSLHRRVDLFFLVDSITQCSHSQKGIAGASYIPIIQEALPRILGAAAPPGASARENRRQCLKVLKLWLERKILPDSLLRSYIEDIGSSNDDTSAGFFSKRPSRAERAIDDPIREMEGMLVDEYGSNATFQLPGLLSANVFEEEDDFLNFSHKEGSGKSVLEQNTATGELETCSVTSNEKRHCILEDVDGELEMEDVSGHPKDEKNLTDDGLYEAVQEDDGSARKMDTASTNSNEASPLREGSPPLPPDSPPPTPPLPSSPPPPLLPPMVPPPPSTPSPLPPPPPPPSILPSQTYPVLAGPPQAPFSQSSGQPMPSNVPMNPRVGAHDAAVRGEVFSQQPLPFLPAVRETYTNPQGSQSQQFQNGNVSLPSRTFQPPMLTQTAACQFQYPNPAMQQHPYPPRYGITKPPDGMRRYGADEQWRPPPNEFGTESQRGAWISNGRPPLSTGPPFVQEGYFRPPMERPPTSNVSFQPTGQNIVPAGAPVPGHGGSLMMPSHNAWRPA
ncbi:ENHANCER OF AG-4 protein 2-like [Bidens hawaiensis]|uniref:ENHANCER OF AG-4 protein 2-like n=1 Tax=Bidens hawaiensis TaxID=980011 RepID=UPI00404A9D8E